MMNHMRKHAVMIVAALVIIAAGYMAYQRYYARHEEVQIQLLNFGTESNGSYQAGYRDGMNDALNQ